MAAEGASSIGAEAAVGSGEICPVGTTGELSALKSPVTPIGAGDGSVGTGGVGTAVG